MPLQTWTQAVVISFLALQLSSCVSQTLHRQSGKGLRQLHETTPTVEGRYPTILLFGDSITELSFNDGWGAKLAGRYAAKADVLNRGFGGYNTKWAAHVLPNIVASLGGHAPLLTIVFLGANDAALPFENGPQRMLSVPVRDYAANLHLLVAYLRAHDARRIVLMTPPPIDDSTERCKGCRRNNWTQLYAQACIEVGAKDEVPVVDLYGGLQDVASWRPLYLSDGLHLTEPGNRRVYKLLQSTVDKHFPELRPTQVPLVFALWAHIHHADPAVTFGALVPQMQRNATPGARRSLQHSVSVARLTSPLVTRGLHSRAKSLQGGFHTSTTSLVAHTRRSKARSLRDVSSTDTVRSEARMDSPAVTHRCPRVLLLGDSLTQRSFDNNGWGAFLTHYLRRKADVINRGYGGYTTKWMAYLLPKIMASLDAPPLLAVILLGTNDATLPKSVQTVPLAEYKSNLLLFVAYLQAHGCRRIILMTPPPVDEFSVGLGSWFNRRLNHTEQYARACQEAAAQAGVASVDLFSKMQDVDDWGSRYLSDGVHLTSNGSLKVFQLLKWGMDKHFKDLRVNDLPIHYHRWPDIHFEDPTVTFGALHPSLDAKQYTPTQRR